MPRAHLAPQLGPATPELADARDLRAAIANALAVSPVDELALRRGVWSYVGAQRHAGTSPGHVIMSLTELVDAGNIAPMAVHQALMRQVILWCVEAYFGHLGGDVVGRATEALADSPASMSGP